MTDPRTSGATRGLVAARAWLNARRKPLGALIALGLVAWLVIGGAADEAARARADALFARALVTFASARALDAVISAAQGTELAFEPAGVGVTLSAGELLDPINDLVEQFATLVLLAATSLGIQSVALRISSWWGLSALLLAAGAAWVGLRWRYRDDPVDRRALRALDGARRVFLVLLLIRFVLPAVTLTSGWIFDAFLEQEQEESLQVLDRTRGEVDALAGVGEAPDPADAEARASWLSRLRDWWNAPAAGEGIEGRLAAFRERVDRAVESIVRLMVIFTLQTLVLPLVLLWLALRIVGSRIG